MAEYIERGSAMRTAHILRPEDKELMSAISIIPAVDVEKMSAGYHTFADLYEQRLILSAALAKNNPHAWKSKRHEDGSEPFGGGWFIMGFDTDEGCYTYHYELKDWDLFQCKELDKGKPWDGHTSKDVRRLLSIPAVSVQQWISIEDAVPAEKAPVLWLLQDGQVFRGGIRNFVEYLEPWYYREATDDYVDSLGRLFDSGDSTWWNNSPITHWMPLPKAPKGENDE